MKKKTKAKGTQNKKTLMNYYSLEEDKRSSGSYCESNSKGHFTSAFALKARVQNWSSKKEISNWRSYFPCE